MNLYLEDNWEFDYEYFRLTCKVVEPDTLIYASNGGMYEFEFLPFSMIIPWGRISLFSRRLSLSLWLLPSFRQLPHLLGIYWQFAPAFAIMFFWYFIIFDAFLYIIFNLTHFQRLNIEAITGIGFNCICLPFDCCDHLLDKKQ